ncbi:MAG: carbohydrate deacetylase [Chthoniobacterales bacterium]
MYPSSSGRHVIVNADDFGLTNGINRGIIEAHEHGIVTSASLMVRYPAAAPAAEYARSHPKLSVGLHFEIAEWRFQNGEWQLHYQIADARDSNAVEAEMQRQLAIFQDLLGRPPSHLDSHQHVHKSGPARNLMLRAAKELRVPLRACDPELTYRGDFYGQTDEGDAFPEGISLGHFVEILGQLGPGWTEIGCHPGYGDRLDSVYREEREEELRVLCTADVRTALQRQRVRLCSFHDFTKRKAPPAG